MNINITINSGAAYLLSFAAVIGFALFIKAGFNEFWIAVASLYGWHTGRRLWRQLKIGTLEVESAGNQGEDTQAK
jgi:hypothetical protein